MNKDERVMAERLLKAADPEVVLGYVAADSNYGHGSEQAGDRVTVCATAVSACGIYTTRSGRRIRE
jgi:hypothetical protein